MALKPIGKGEEIVIDYMASFCLDCDEDDEDPKFCKKDELKKFYLFECRCPVCFINI
jgi:hypothetical protein